MTGKASELAAGFQKCPKDRSGEPQRAVASNLIELHLFPAAKSDQNIKPARR